MRCSHGSELKSPSKMKLSYLDENRSQYLPITARCFVIKVLLDCMSNITISFFLWLTLHKKLQSRNQFSKGWKEHLLLRKVVSHPLFHPCHICYYHYNNIQKVKLTPHPRFHLKHHYITMERITNKIWNSCHIMI